MSIFPIYTTNYETGYDPRLHKAYGYIYESTNLHGKVKHMIDHKGHLSIIISGDITYLDIYHLFHSWVYCGERADQVCIYQYEMTNKGKIVTIIGNDYKKYKSEDIDDNGIINHYK